MAIRPVEKIDGIVPVRHAIISVSDKSGLDELVPTLVTACPGIVIYSTGGTYAKLKEILGADAEGTVKDVASYIGQPETEGGLVKTLDFKLFLGYLTETYCEAHQQDLKRTGSVPIDLVIFNLYPFKDTVAERGDNYEAARGNIDVGGPSALRAAAKNWHRIATVVDPADYAQLIEELRTHDGAITGRMRYTLAQKVWRALANYNTAIADYHEETPFEKAIEPYDVVNPGE